MSGMRPPDWSTLVYANLRRGKDAARSLSELAEGMNVPRRTLEKAVQELRHRGFAIASGQPGVWEADSAVDLDDTLDSMKSRLIEQYRTYSALKRTRSRLRTIESRGEVEQLFLDLSAA